MGAHAVVQAEPTPRARLVEVLAPGSARPRATGHPRERRRPAAPCRALAGFLFLPPTTPARARYRARLAPDRPRGDYERSKRVIGDEATWAAPGWVGTK